LVCSLVGIEAWAQSPDTIRNTLSRVVLITAQDESGKPMAFGSGFVIDSEGRIASNLHVLAGASSASVRFVNHNEKFAVRSVSAFSSDWDLVILRIDKNSTPLATGDSTRLQIGDRVLAFGNPEGLEGTVSEGIVSALRKLDGEIRLIQITAAISPGSSGGPVMDRDGKVVGLASASILSGQNLNFAIPIEYLRKLVANGLKELPMSDLKRNADVSLALPLFPGKSEGQVKALDFGDDGGVGPSPATGEGGRTNVRFSVQNNLDKDIRNIRILVVWKRGNEKLDYSAYLVRDTIPANQAVQVGKKDKWGVIRFLARPQEFSYDVRVLDYEIVPKSGELEFK
jgi:S1-C subfamily serine protease